MSNFKVPQREESSVQGKSLAGLRLLLMPASLRIRLHACTLCTVFDCARRIYVTVQHPIHPGGLARRVGPGVGAVVLPFAGGFPFFFFSGDR
jgi:hypothetical protein